MVEKIAETYYLITRKIKTKFSCYFIVNQSVVRSRRQMADLIKRAEESWVAVSNSV